MSKVLHNIGSPTDLKKLAVESLPQLAAEIREDLVAVLSQTGGHLGGNLGVVELTLALHYVFDTPADKIIWDVGHQCYVHKMLTGRREQLKTIRQYGGIAGFARISESEHDCYGAGHASTSISAAYGLAVSRDLSGQDHQVIAVIGDGSMTGGLAFEGLNNLGSSQRNMIIVLNDNSMSISPNVGALSDYLTGLMADQTYNKVKGAIWELAGRFKSGSQLRETMKKVDKSIKSLLVPGILFEKLGVRYFGPVDGHDSEGLVRVLRQLKSLPGPKLLHIRTVKGKGYRPAEEDSCRLHGVNRFDKVTGKTEKSVGASYTGVFGKTLVELASADPDIVAVTAAMPTGTGLADFAELYPDRFFDVGIAEQHAAVFSGGLARGGKKAVAAIYSTFLQRAFDPLIHDLALQRLPVLLAIDRAGLVGADGPTHHGCFDISYLRLIPDIQICAPKDGAELRQLLRQALRDLKGPIAIRFPRAKIPDESTVRSEELEWGTWETLREGKQVAILAVGSMVHNALAAAELLAAHGVEAAVLNCRFIKPLDVVALTEVSGNYSHLVTVEEGSLVGGFGSAINDWLADNDRQELRLRRLGLPDTFVEHGSRDTLLSMVSLHPQGIAKAVLSSVRPEGGRSVTMKPLAETTASRLAPTEFAVKGEE